MVIPKSLIWIILVGLFVIQSTGVIHPTSTYANKTTCRNVITSNPTTVIKKERHTILVTPVECLPTSILFRAVSHITDSRAMVSPQWSSYYFGTHAIPMYRPDVGTSKPAYYEIEVFADARRSKSAGFIILTNPTTKTEPNAIGRIDYPIAHWDSQGTSVSTSLLRQSKIATGNVIIWKMDTLSYVATHNNRIIGQLGDLPTPFTGLTQAKFDTYSNEDMISAVTYTPLSTVRDAKATGKFNRSTSGPTYAEVSKLYSFVIPTSFSNYLSRYKQGFQLHINSLRLQTVTDWTYEAMISPNENTYRIPVPANSTTLVPIPFAGITSKNVRIIDTNDKIFSSASLTKSRTQQFPTLRLVTGDLSESLRTATATITVNGVVKMNFTFYLIDNKTTQSITEEVASKSGRNHGHNRWHTFSAGTDAQQRLYYQFNYRDCKVGCGSVAWMMLFGWYDYRSSPEGGNTFNRWNTFRADGSASGSGTRANGIAPRTNNTGVERATTNIRDRIGTFCSFGGSGATPPWGMDRAAGYLSQMKTGLGIRVHYNAVGVHEDSLRDMVRDEIQHRGRPAIIGTGWMVHYPLAYKYRWKSRPEKFLEGWFDGNDVVYTREFYVNQGWGGGGNGWISAGTWFSGRGIP
jgi:hypothetical protein